MMMMMMMRMNASYSFRLVTMMISLFFFFSFSTTTTTTATAFVGVPMMISMPRPATLLIAKSNNGTPKIDDWQILSNGRIVGTIFDHPTLPNGDTITTSPAKGDGNKFAPRSIITTVSGSKYTLGTPGRVTMETKKKQQQTTPGIKVKDLQRQAKVAFDLNGDVVGDDTVTYLLSGVSQKSTSGKSQIYKAYRADKDRLPTGQSVMVKVSRNWEALEREAENYGAITQRGFQRGQFVKLMHYFPDASTESSKFRNSAAIVMERGVIDLKKYISTNGPLQGKRLRDAAAAVLQCVQAIHGSNLVWTDLKSENFIVCSNGAVKGIDLESAMPVNGNPVDYSPEGTPPEFARAFLAGDGPYFVLRPNYDIWSLGMLLYEISTGRSYFGNSSPVQITKMLRDGPVMDVRAIEDRRLRNLVASCLLTDPKKRPSTVQLLLHPYFLSSGVGPLSF